eukprot:gnl/TRDRNA2_/TRDRNA2_46594_c0_seq1.p1 gnl/TRDRNA2_/TRDRNA2_46594_c0~~gnl/TRDRNA2_/TRDRNA2_46594_c0_seq1.p1  ORF type:complete len:323 (+),score=73.77 gnl/TRDRNA2_/TRDRNA2_46594_c0_seq1:88-1056(+)
MEMAASHSAVLVCLLAACLSPVAAEFISDLGSSPQDENHALELKAEQFWDPVVEAAEKTKMEAYYTKEHEALYSDMERVIAELPAENVYVRKALGEGLEALRSADKAVVADAEQAAQIASERLAVPAGAHTSTWSFLTGGQDFFKQVIRSFVNGGSRFPERLQKQIGNRQADVLPLLRGTQAVTGNVLRDSKLASARGFDVLKYDLYNKGVPATPEAAKAVANRLVDAAGDTRHRFMHGITNVANSIANDEKGKHDDPSVTVLRASLQSTPGLIESSNNHIEPLVTVGKPSLNFDTTLQRKSGELAMPSLSRAIYTEQLVSV